MHLIPGGLVATLSSGLLPELLDLFMVHTKDAHRIEIFKTGLVIWMWKREHIGDFQAAQINSIFNLKKKKKKA